MCLTLNSITYEEGFLTVDILKDYKSDFAFYVFKGTSKVGIKLYCHHNVSKLKIDLIENKVYCLKIFLRPLGVETVKEEDKVTKKIFFCIKNNSEIHVFNDEVLFESENIKITEYNQNSEITFVTFNSAFTDKTSNPFGIDFVLSKGWNLISLHKHNQNKYQDLSLDIFSKVVKPRVESKDVYVYGTSLGGYCAFYFGGVINATIIAGSPMLSVHPLVNREEYKHIKYKHNDILENPKTTKPTYILYDPLESGDVRFIRNVILPSYPNAHFIPVKGGTHLTIKTLQKRGILKDIIQDLVDGDCFSAINRVQLSG